MRVYYIGIITIIIVVVGLLLFPSLHLMTGMVDTTGFLPLTKAVGVTFAPYFFLFGIGYVVFKVVKH